MYLKMKVNSMQLKEAIVDSCCIDRVLCAFHSHGGPRLLDRNSDGLQRDAQGTCSLHISVYFFYTPDLLVLYGA